MATRRKSLKLWKIFFTKFTRCSASTGIILGLEDLLAVVCFLGLFCALLVFLSGLRMRDRDGGFIRLLLITPVTNIHILSTATTRTWKSRTISWCLWKSIKGCGSTEVGD